MKTNQQKLFIQKFYANNQAAINIQNVCGIFLSELAFRIGINH